MNSINYLRYKLHMFFFWRKHPVEPCGVWFAIKRTYYSGLSFKELKANRGHTIYQVTHGTDHKTEFKIY